MLHPTAWTTASAKPHGGLSRRVAAWRCRLAGSPHAVQSTWHTPSALPVHEHNALPLDEQMGTHPIVRPIGPEPQSLTPLGLVPNTACMSEVGQEWQPLLGSITQAYLAVFGQRLLGVYLRGSLPQGLFVAGVSDVDTFALLLDGEQEHGSNDSAVALRQHVRTLEVAHGHLHFTKIEAKTASIPAASAAGILLSQTSQACDATPSAHTLPLWVLQHMPMAFELKAQCVCLWGVDLPVLLPDVAALPSATPQLLPSLVEDVEAAVHSAHKHADDSRLQARAAMWALKRCIRAAFELVAQEVSVHTRDLYWCTSIAGQRLPHLQQQLKVALELYVLLLEAPQQEQRQELQQEEQEQRRHRSLPPPPPCLSSDATHVNAVVQAACKLASSLCTMLDDAFCEQMLTEEPGWLTQHVAASQQEATKHPWTGWLGQLMQSTRLPSETWDVMESQVAGCHPPLVRVPISGSVQELQWADEAQRSTAAAAIAACCQPVQNTLRFHAALQQRSAEHHQPEHPPLNQPPQQQHQQQQQHQHHQQQQQAAACPAPLVLRGLASDWQQCRGWDLQWLHRQSFAGKVRVAQSLQIPFVEPALLAFLTATKGAAAAPSIEVDMPAREFAERLCRTGGHGPIVYGTHEHYYLQAQLPEELAAAVHLQPLLSAVTAASAAAGRAMGHANHGSHKNGSPAEAAPTVTQAVRFSQQPRLWVAAWGSVSPLHMDLSHSFLVQLRGAKRMLFFAPEQTPFLYPYPHTHLLRRRSRVNVSAPDTGKHALFGRACAVEALLRPGDAVWFPASWWHYTESHGGADDEGRGISVSVTCRLAVGTRADSQHGVIVD